MFECWLRTGGNPRSEDVRARRLRLLGHPAIAESSTDYARYARALHSLTHVPPKDWKKRPPGRPRTAWRRHFSHNRPDDGRWRCRVMNGLTPLLCVFGCILFKTTTTPTLDWCGAGVCNGAGAGAESAMTVALFFCFSLCFCIFLHCFCWHLSISVSVCDNYLYPYIKSDQCAERMHFRATCRCITSHSTLFFLFSSSSCGR